MAEQFHYDYVSRPECEAKHAHNADKIDLIAKYLEKIETRQWFVLTTVAGTAALLLINMFTKHI